MSLEKSYRVSFLEIVCHVGVVQARSAKAARTLARKDWDEVGAEAFKQESSTITDRINVMEVRS